MAILNDRDLMDAIGRKIISITPLDANNIQPASIDLTLHDVIEVFDPRGNLDIASLSKNQLKEFNREVNIASGYCLEPGKFITGYSAELIKIPSFITGRIYNRNSLARCGINAAISSFITPGFSGRKVIVIHNFSDFSVKICPGMRICQLELYKLPHSAMRSFEDRHNPSKLETPTYQKYNPPIDNSLSEFLQERIIAAAKRM